MSFVSPRNFLIICAHICVFWCTLVVHVKSITHGKILGDGAIAVPLKKYWGGGHVSPVPPGSPPMLDCDTGLSLGDCQRHEQAEGQYGNIHLK